MKGLRDVGLLGIVIFAFFNFLNPTGAQAATTATVKLGWNASTGTDTVGYAVYYGVVGALSTNRTDVSTNLVAVVPGLAPGTNYFFYVVAYTANGTESLPSNQIQFQPAVILSPAFAAPVKLAWDPSQNTNAVGYAVYYGMVGSTTTNRLDMGMALEATVPNVYAGTNYYFFVVAYAANGMESEPSNWLEYCPQVLTQVKVGTAEDGTPLVGFRAPVGASCYVEYTDSLSAPDWHPVGPAIIAAADGSIAVNDVIPSTTGMRFYRAVYP